MPLQNFLKALRAPEVRREAIRSIRVILPFGLWQRHVVARRPTPARSVVMFHLGHSGSTVLADQLIQHSDIFWAKEIARKSYVALNRLHLPLVRRVDLGRLTQDHMADCPTPVFGCEMKPFHIRMMGSTLPQYFDQMQGLGIDHVILLRRKNTLRKIVSTLSGRQRGSFHSRSDGAAKLIKVHINIDDIFMDGEHRALVAFLDLFEQSLADTRAAAQARGMRLLELTFEEDILPDPSHAYHEICRFLDLPEQDSTVRLSRTNPFALSEMIANFDEVQAALKGTSHAWMLDAP